MSCEQVARDFLGKGPLPIKDLCDLILQLAAEPGILTKFKARVARVHTLLLNGPLPVKEICNIISALSAEPELVCRLTIPNAGWVNTLCVLPHGVLAVGAHGGMVTGRLGGMVTLYDMNNGDCMLKLGHAQSVSALTSLPDGKLASGSADGKVRMWSIETGQCLLTLAGHTRVVGGLVLLPDGQLASSSWDGTLRVWNLESGTQSMVMHASQKVYALAVQLDGKLVSGSDDYTLRVWDSASGACLSCTQVGTIITAITVMPDGNLAMTSTDGKLRVWDVSIGAFSTTLASPFRTRSALVGFPDGSLVLSNCGLTSTYYHTNFEAMDANSGCLFEIGLRNQIAMAALPDGGLVTASDSYQIHVWE